MSILRAILPVTILACTLAACRPPYQTTLTTQQVMNQVIDPAWAVPRASLISSGWETVARERSEVRCQPPTAIRGSDVATTRSLKLEYLPPIEDRGRYLADAAWSDHLRARYDLVTAKWRPSVVVSYGTPVEEFLSGVSVAPVRAREPSPGLFLGSPLQDSDA